MSHCVIYKDESLDIIIEVSDNKFTRVEFEHIVEIYRKKGFYGNFKQMKI